jgi:hypothetical protein
MIASYTFPLKSYKKLLKNKEKNKTIYCNNTLYARIVFDNCTPDRINWHYLYLPGNATDDFSTTRFT